jgi:uncharacterized protein (DUF58 family)
MKVDPPETASEPDRTSLDQRLHWIYYRTTGLHYFIVRRCRPAGLTLAVVFALAACLGLGQSLPAIHQMFSLSLGMLLIGFTWTMIRRASLEGKRELPRFATAGEKLRYHVRIQHRGKGDVRRAWLSDTPPDPRPSLEDFSILREPGEEERNRFDRKFAYFRWCWLLLGNQSFSGGFSSKEMQIKRGRQERIPVELTPLRRGVIHLDDLRVLLPDPFGLFQRCRKVKAPASSLTVLPKRYPLPPIELPGGAAFKVSGEANTNTIGTSGEFVGLRDYRPGDPLRQIHWKSWARLGRPIVKELEDTFYPRYGLIVDTFSCNRTDHQFEEAISVAASFAASIDTSDSLLDLMFIKDEAHRVTAGRGLERSEKLLEVLAGVSPERHDNFADLSRLVLRHRDDLTSCLIIFNGWNPARSGFLKTLTGSRVACIPLIIGSGQPTGSAPGYWLESGKIAQSLQRLPRQLLAAS